VTGLPDRADTLLATARSRFSPDRPEISVPLTQCDGSTLFASGQVASRDGVLLATGLVGRDVDLATAQACAWQCAHNLLAAVQQELGSLDAVAAAVRLTVYVASVDGFTDQHLVAHGASRLILAVLGDRGHHARTAIGVKALPLNSPVEADAIFRVQTGTAYR